MRINPWRLAGALFAIVLTVTLLVAIPYSVQQYSDSHVAGFWYGLWNGLTLSLAFFVSLFNHHVQIYELRNNGGWYNWGFVMGVSLFWTLISFRKRRHS